MQPTKAELIYHRNVDFEEVLQLVDTGTGQAIDLTGDELELKLWSTADDGDPDYTFDSFAELSTGWIEKTDPVNGKLTIILPPNALPVGSYTYYLTHHDGGDEVPRMFGTLSSREGVSQPAALLNSGTQGISAWFDWGVARVIDTTTPANDFYGNPNDLFSYNSPSTKYIRNRSGWLEAGTALRTEYDGDHVALGVRIEAQKTNTTTYSQEFDNAAWLKSQMSVSANRIMAPDGTFTADQFIENTSSADHRIYKNVTYSSGTTYTRSVWARSNGRNLQITMPVDSGTGFARFDLENGVVLASGGTGVSAGMEKYSLGWWRCWITIAATESNTRQWAFSSLDGSTQVYTGDGASGVFLWGAQDETGTLTSYMPTTSSSTTRVGDQIKYAYPFDDTIISGLIVYRRVFDNAANKVAMGFANEASPSANERLYIQSPSVTTTRSQLVCTTGGSQVAAIALAGSNQDGEITSAFRAQANDYAISVDGNTVATDTSGAMPATTLDRLAVGSAPWSLGATPVNGHVRRLHAQPANWNNTTLETLSS